MKEEIKGVRTRRPAPPGRPAPLKNMDQKDRIRRRLEERGETRASLARKLNAPPGSVYNNIAGYKSDPKLQERIAAFLGVAAAELFAPSPQPSPLRERGLEAPRLEAGEREMRSAGETPALRGEESKGVQAGTPAPLAATKGMEIMDSQDTGAGGLKSVRKNLLENQGVLFFFKKIGQFVVETVRGGRSAG